MATAFQPNAFQNDTFQTLWETAFQPDAFQNDAFQIIPVSVPPIPPIPGAPGIPPTRLRVYRPIIIDGYIKEKQLGNREWISGMIVLSGTINNTQNKFNNKIIVHLKNKDDKDFENILLMVTLDD